MYTALNFDDDDVEQEVVEKRLEFSRFSMNKQRTVLSAFAITLNMSLWTVWLVIDGDLKTVLDLS